MFWHMSYCWHGCVLYTCMYSFSARPASGNQPVKNRCWPWTRENQRISSGYCTCCAEKGFPHMNIFQHLCFKDCCSVDVGYLLNTRTFYARHFTCCKAVTNYNMTLILQRFVLLFSMRGWQHRLCSSRPVSSRQVWTFKESIGLKDSQSLCNIH